MDEALETQLKTSRGRFSATESLPTLEELVVPQRWTQQRYRALGTIQNAVECRALSVNPSWNTSNVPFAVAFACGYWGYATHSRSVRSSARPGSPTAKMISLVARLGSHSQKKGAVSLAALPMDRPSQTGRTFVARLWATPYRWPLLEPVTASISPSPHYLVPDQDGGPGKLPPGVPAALAPPSWTLRAAGVAVEAAAAPSGRVAPSWGRVPSPSPAPQNTQNPTPRPLGLL
ncbi:PREDICTED: retbindin isoform X11 [Cercocebus atys]|uniref:retbindin isoform X11 n=1 Tax=Cercocebus atys TaxID=9531 RepID=UPI0005F48690|nr:PREDICTED: retbindin isoform X11 [Cercocebus atys]